MSTFDELFDEFFNDKNKPKKRGRKKKSFKDEINDELSNLINVISNAKQITDKEEQYMIDNEYGEPSKIEYYNDDELYFKKSTWIMEDGEIVKLEVSDVPFDIENSKSLEELLQEAINAEDFEKAAEIRDEINKNKL